MKTTHTTSRPLFWGALLTVGALALTNGTGTVRADDTRSLPTSVSQTAPLPYFWMENNDAQIHLYMLQAEQCLFNPQRTASQAFYGIGLANASSLAARSLD